MIIIPTSIFKSISEKKDKKLQLVNYINDLYQCNVDKYDLNQCKCNKCSCVGNFCIKGYYYRNIVINFQVIKIRITRVKCKSCGRTHAIFFEDFIPYFSHTSHSMVSLHINNFHSNMYSYDFLLRLKKRFTIFLSFLRDKLNINNIHESNKKTITTYQKSYLQIHKGIVIAIASP